METLNIIQIAVSVLLIISVLLQQRGAGLGSMFGGQDDVYRTKRGFEKFLSAATIILAIAFLGTALASMVIQ